MEDTVHEVEEFPEKRITVTTVVVDGRIETTVQHTDPEGDASGQPDATEATIIGRPLSAGNPLLQHDLIVRDVHTGTYDDFSQHVLQGSDSVPEDYLLPGEEGNPYMNDRSSEPILPPADPDTEPSDANPVPLSPTDPRRRTEAAPCHPDAALRPMNAGAVPVVVPVPEHPDSGEEE
jgi:hypothetical protein